MHILILSETLTAGGAEAFAVRLANAFVTSHRVTLAIMHGERINEDLLRHLSPEVKVERLNLPGKRILWKVDSALRRVGLNSSIIRILQRRWLAQILSRDPPDIIHSHLLKADLLAIEMKLRLGASFGHVVTLHGDYAPFFHRQADPQLLELEAAIRQVAARADALVGVCAEHLDFLVSHYEQSARGKLHLVYNGYAPFSNDYVRRSKAELGLPSGKRLLGMVARGVENKGWAIAIEAFGTLQRDDLALILVGEGPFLDRLRRQSVADNVIFAGFSPNPLEYIQHFDLCLLPTLFPHESLPTVIIEYLRCGKPVVATDVGEIRTMIADDEGELAGRLLAFRNGTVAVADLKQAIAELLDDPATLEQMGQRARRAFHKFEMDICVSAYEQLYRANSPPRLQ